MGNFLDGIETNCPSKLLAPITEQLSSHWEDGSFNPNIKAVIVRNLSPNFFYCQFQLLSSDSKARDCTLKGSRFNPCRVSETSGKYNPYVLDIVQD